MQRSRLVVSFAVVAVLGGLAAWGRFSPHARTQPAPLVPIDGSVLFGHEEEIGATDEEIAGEIAVDLRDDLTPGELQEAETAYGLEPNANDTPLRKLQKERCIERASAIVYLNDMIAIGRWDSSELDNYLKLHTKLFENLAELGLVEHGEPPREHAVARDRYAEIAGFGCVGHLWRAQKA